MPVTIGNLRATWANSLITYTGIGLNVNATSYSTDSSLIDLKLNSNTLFKLASNGVLYVNGYSVITGSDSNTNILFDVATKSFEKANAANILASQAFDQANSSNIIAIQAFNQANAAYVVSANVQTFTASGTWYKPAVGSMVKIQLWGGGGSGAARVGRPSNTSTGQVSSGGGGGAYREYTYPLSDFGSTVTVTIGAGGAAITSANSNGNDGGTTSFGSLNGAGGGLGGKQDRKTGLSIGCTSATFPLITGRGGDNDFIILAPHFTGSNGGSLGYTTFSGSITNYSWANTSNAFYGGGGGGGISQFGATMAQTWQIGRSISILGGNGGEQGNTANGIAGTEPGGGGGGALNTSSNTYVMSSGAGANGKAIITVW